MLGPAVIDALGNPRIMVLLSTSASATSLLPLHGGERVLRVFEKAGYLLVDPTQAGTLKDIDPHAARSAKLREIARDFQADVLIYGKAYASSYADQKISGIRI